MMRRILVLVTVALVMAAMMLAMAAPAFANNSVVRFCDPEGEPGPFIGSQPPIVILVPTPAPCTATE